MTADHLHHVQGHDLPHCGFERYRSRSGLPRRLRRLAMTLRVFAPRRHGEPQTQQSIAVIAPNTAHLS